MASFIGSKLVNGALTFFSKTTAADIATFDPASARYIDGTIVYQKRARVAVADIASGSGAEVLPAIAGYKYRLVAAKAIAIGGSAAAVTTVDLVGTLSASTRKLVAWAQASLTQSAVLREGGTGATVLADGASYTANDANSAITLGRTGSAITTATHIDVVVEYAIEAA